MEYGVLARDRFLKRLTEIRKLGRFKELLEEGGAILYRNLFREDQVEEAWKLLTLLRPWSDKLVCTLSGERVPLKDVQDVLWCAGFLGADKPCRGPAKKKERPVGCKGARILLGPGQWGLEDKERRHAMTFSKVDADGMLTFDHEAIADYVGSSTQAGRCPASPARDPEAFAAAFESISVRTLGWPLVAVMSPELKKAIGDKHLEAEHGFVLRKDIVDLEPHEALELVWDGETLCVRRPGERQGSLASEISLPVKLKRVIEGGTVLRAVRMQEAYARRKGGHYEVEQRFQLTQRVHLLPTDRAVTFAGYELATFPRSTEAYLAWVDRVTEALP